MPVRRYNVVRRGSTLAAVLAVAQSRVVVHRPHAEAAPGPSSTNPAVLAPNSADPTLVQPDGRHCSTGNTM
ncbi:hypothetical protein LZG04_28715 [Saccharothrix sp. S26]|nr:hypothetical protein [Saccharothrix sp. S26]